MIARGVRGAKPLFFEVLTPPNWRPFVSLFVCLSVCQGGGGGGRGGGGEKVCLSVCLSVCLFVNSLTGRLGQQRLAAPEEVQKLATLHIQISHMCA